MSRTDAQNQPTATKDWVIRIRFGDEDVPHDELADEIVSWLALRFPGFSGTVTIMSEGNDAKF